MNIREQSSHALLKGLTKNGDVLYNLLFCNASDSLKTMSAIPGKKVIEQIKQKTEYAVIVLPYNEEPQSVQLLLIYKS